MLLLYRHSCAGWCPDYQIYIPLCFYFIRISLCAQDVGLRFTFHYASTLSMDDIKLKPCPFWFTFHYASTLSKKRPMHLPVTFIYIPLCFYFIKGDILEIEEYHPFTFHYASTLSTVVASASTSLMIFTFHYASTLSVLFVVTDAMYY